MPLFLFPFPQLHSHFLPIPILRFSSHSHPAGAGMDTQYSHCHGILMSTSSVKKTLRTQQLNSKEKFGVHNIIGILRGCNNFQIHSNFQSFGYNSAQFSLIFDIV
jgi:hypothetical protein